MKFSRLKKAFVDPNIFGDYASQYGISDKSVNNVTDISFRFNSGWTMYIGEDDLASDGTQLFWCNTMTPQGEEMGSSWKMTQEAVFQYIDMVGNRVGV